MRKLTKTTINLKCGNIYKLECDINFIVQVRPFTIELFVEKTIVTYLGKLDNAELMSVGFIDPTYKFLVDNKIVYRYVFNTLESWFEEITC